MWIWLSLKWWRKKWWLIIINDNEIEIDAEEKEFENNKITQDKGLFGNDNNVLFSNDKNFNIIFNNIIKKYDLFENSANFDKSNRNTLFNNNINNTDSFFSNNSVRNSLFWNNNNTQEIGLSRNINSESINNIKYKKLIYLVIIWKIWVIFLMKNLPK